MSNVKAQLLYIAFEFYTWFTNLIQHLVTFIENKNLYASETELFVAD